MDEPSDEPTDRDRLEWAISAWLEIAVISEQGAPDFWDELSTTEHLAEALEPLLAAVREEGRREAMQWRHDAARYQMLRDWWPDSGVCSCPLAMMSHDLDEWIDAEIARQRPPEPTR